MSMARRSMWAVDSRVIVYAAIGAALYGVLGLFSFLLPGTQNVTIRPAFALVAFFGYGFGPIVGLFVGFVGNAIGDQINGYGFLTYWNWSLANGLAGFVAGLAALYVGGMMTGSLSRRALGGAIAGIVGSVIGFLFVFSDIWVGGSSFDSLLTTGYIPIVTADIIVSVILIPILVYAWEPVKEQLGR
ncbi:MAG TPA: ECF transporter S component [Candidatus Limnocylindrales bacterium]|nr:ECF transporter S component [Candidatus Limnocylindrales bacterium]